MKHATKYALAIAAASLLGAGTAVQASEIKFKSSGGLKWETEDGKASGQFGGRVMVDGNYYDEDVDTTHETGMEFRRLRLFAKGQYLDYSAKIQIDFADSDVDIKDAYIAKKAFNGKVIVGHYKQPFGLEELTSSKYITFMERAFSGIPTSRKLGVGYAYSSDHNTFSVGAYDPDSLGDENGTDEDGVGFGGRYTWAPHVDKGFVTHFGIAAASETDMDRYRVRPRIGHLASRTVVMDVTGTNDVDVTKFGLEGAIVRGPFSLQAEYQTANAEGTTQDETTNAFYVYGSYFLTGDARPYKAKSGAFDRVKPISPEGAWELALRYEMAENDDTDAEAEAITAGLNYYATPYVRWMFNVVKGDLTPAGGPTDKPTAVLARFQLDF
ncbi:MAG: porin [Salinisphaeraceae bacterium]|nr:porin [Salinisphaeraceae bacterium]